MLAIVIPYYKLKFFLETLQSLANQTDQRFKVYIGDDASPESPSYLLELYKNHFDFEHHHFEDNLGGTSLVKQWERCMIMINGEKWLMILGDDDVLENNCVASFYKNLEEIEALKISAIRFSTRVINDKGDSISENYLHPKIESTGDFLMRKLNGGTRSSLSEYIFEKEMIEQIKFKDFPLAWNSDLLAVLEFSRWNNIFTINEAIVCFRLSGMNITSKKDNLIIKNNATFQFYFYLLHEQTNKLSKELIDILFDRFEKTILDNKKHAIYWVKLFYLYLKFFQIKRFLSLGFKIKKSIK